jgi:hypothetical protein
MPSYSEMPDGFDHHLPRDLSGRERETIEWEIELYKSLMVEVAELLPQDLTTVEQMRAAIDFLIAEKPELRELAERVSDLESVRRSTR